MKIGVISDTHDNMDNTRKVIARLKELDVEALIHCGDLSAPFMMPILADLGKHVYYTFGNNEAEIKAIIEHAEKHEVNIMRMKTGEYIGELELGGKKIAFTHYGEIGTALAYTKRYDVVFHGHMHAKREEIIEGVLVVNPGEVTNLKSAGSFAVYDTETNKVEFFDVG